MAIFYKIYENNAITFTRKGLETLCGMHFAALKGRREVQLRNSKVSISETKIRRAEHCRMPYICAPQAHIVWPIFSVVYYILSLKNILSDIQKFLFLEKDIWKVKSLIWFYQSEENCTSIMCLKRASSVSLRIYWACFCQCILRCNAPALGQVHSENRVTKSTTENSKSEF